MWRRNPILFWTSTGHAVLLLGFLVGLAVDPRTVGGDPARLKPAKFAASMGLFTGVLAWLSPHPSAVAERRGRIADPRRLVWLVEFGHGGILPAAFFLVITALIA